MKKTLFFLTLLGASPAFCLERIYIGGAVGEVGLTNGGSYKNAIGFGGDLSFRTNPILDVALRSQYSSHSGGAGMTLWSNTVSADFLIANFYDIEWFVGAGPGFYIFSGKDSKFGLHGETFGDLLMGNLRFGMGFRFHGLFDAVVGEGSYWTLMARIGFSFEMGP